MNTTHGIHTVPNSPSIRKQLVYFSTKTLLRIWFTLILFSIRIKTDIFVHYIVVNDNSVNLTNHLSDQLACKLGLNLPRQKA